MVASASLSQTAAGTPPALLRAAFMGLTGLLSPKNPVIHWACVAHTKGAEPGALSPYKQEFTEATRYFGQRVCLEVLVQWVR